MNNNKAEILNFIFSGPGATIIGIIFLICAALKIDLHRKNVFDYLYDNFYDKDSSIWWTKVFGIIMLIIGLFRLITGI